LTGYVSGLSYQQSAISIQRSACHASFGLPIDEEAVGSLLMADG
jgi:hypothetical protein